MSEELAVKPKRRNRRRPDGVIEVPMNVRVTAQQRAEISARAAERGISMSTVIREALDQALEQVPMCGDAR
jgi:predicted HicB family RNase H-like nuclease